MKHTNERGSIFFYILLGIALFAGLSYAVTQSMRVGSGTVEAMNKEKMELYYTEVTSYLESIKLRVFQMEKMEGIKETDIDFNTSKYMTGGNTVTCWNDNANCSSSACSVFSPDNPSGIKPVVFNDIASKRVQVDTGRLMNGHLSNVQGKINGIGSSAPERIIIIRGIDPTFCNYYNLKQGITTNFTDTSVMEDIGETSSNSSAANLGGCGGGALFNTTNTFADQATQFKGKKTFCVPSDYLVYAPTLGIWYVIKSR